MTGAEPLSRIPVEVVTGEFGKLVELRDAKVHDPTVDERLLEIERKIEVDDYEEGDIPAYIEEFEKGEWRVDWQDGEP